MANKEKKNRPERGVIKSLLLNMLTASERKAEARVAAQQEAMPSAEAAPSTEAAPSAESQYISEERRRAEEERQQLEAERRQLEAERELLEAERRRAKDACRQAEEEKSQNEAPQQEGESRQAGAEARQVEAEAGREKQATERALLEVEHRRAKTAHWQAEEEKLHQDVEKKDREKRRQETPLPARPESAGPGSPLPLEEIDPPQPPSGGPAFFEEERTPEAVLEEKEIDPNRPLAAGHPLFELYVRRMGMPPVEDPELTFPLSQFVEDDQNPTDEQRSWLTQAERAARELLKKNQKRPEGDDAILQEEVLDASVMVFVSRDKMSASFMAFPPAMAGQEAEEEVLRTALQERGVVFGLDEDKIQKLGQRPHYFRLFQIAAGEAAIDGDNGEVIDHFKRELEIQLTVKEDNTIDYKDLGWLQTINEGQAICNMVPPTSAVAGHDVLGGEVRGKNGQKAIAPMGQNTKMDEDGETLIATIEGVVSFANGRFRVDPILIIKGSIATETGNLDSIGDILIHGDIQEGFTVQATGNITVQGMIEGAHVMAGGDIQVGRGMNGNSHGVLQAKGEVRSKFIENATVTSGGKIVCDTIINSTVSSDVAVVVTTGRGAIIGGHITALERIEAKSIGNQSNRNIVITMGSTANYLRDKHEMEQKHRTLVIEVEETQKNIRFLDAGVNSAPELAQMADDLKLKLSVLKMQLAVTTRQLEEMNKKQVKSSDCRLRTDILYPPAQITIGDATKIQRQTVFNATIYYKKGEIDIANV